MWINDVLRHKAGSREVATVTGETSIRDALARLAEWNVGALVVSADGRRVDGVLSERDVVRGLDRRGAGLLADPVSTLMTVPVRTCSSTASVVELARLMTEHRVRHVPVVDAGQLIGIVSIGDVVKARLDELETEREQLVDYIQTR